MEMVHIPAESFGEMFILKTFFKDDSVFAKVSLFFKVKAGNKSEKNHENLLTFWKIGL